MSERWITSREAMAHLGTFTNLQAFNRAVHRDGIPHRYAGGNMVFQKARLDAWVATHKPRKRGPKPRVDRKSE